MSNEIPRTPSPKIPTVLPGLMAPIGVDKVNAGYKGPAPNAPAAVLRPSPPPQKEK